MIYPPIFIFFKWYSISSYQSLIYIPSKNQFFQELINNQANKRIPSNSWLKLPPTKHLPHPSLLFLHHKTFSRFFIIILMLCFIKSINPWPPPPHFNDKLCYKKNITCTRWRTPLILEHTYINDRNKNPIFFFFDFFDSFFFAFS